MTCAPAASRHFLSDSALISWPSPKATPFFPSSMAPLLCAFRIFSQHDGQTVRQVRHPGQERASFGYDHDPFFLSFQDFPDSVRDIGNAGGDVALRRGENDQPPFFGELRHLGPFGSLLL